MIKRTQASQINHNTAFNLLFQLHANATIELSMSHTNFLLFSTRFFFTFCKANGELPLSSYTYVTCWHLLLLILLILHPLCCYYIYYYYFSVCVSARARLKSYLFAFQFCVRFTWLSGQHLWIQCSTHGLSFSPIPNTRTNRTHFHTKSRYIKQLLNACHAKNTSPLCIVCAISLSVSACFRYHIHRHIRAHYWVW